MECGFCGREIPDEPDAEKGCGACPGGCRKVHCTACGYANPVIPGFLKRWTRKKNDERKDGQE
jgi:hypothetical protein